MAIKFGLEYASSTRTSKSLYLPADVVALSSKGGNWLS